MARLPFPSKEVDMAKAVKITDGTETVAVSTSSKLETDDVNFVAEDGALGKGVLLQGDDGTDRHNVAVDTSGNVQVDIVSGGGTATAKTVTTAIDNVTFDDDPTTQTSSDIDTSTYDYGFLEIDVAVTDTPTDALIEVFTGDAATPTRKIMDGPLGDLRYEDSAGTKNECIKVPYLGDFTAIKVTCTGTDATHKFTITVKFVGIVAGY